MYDNNKPAPGDAEWMYAQRVIERFYPDLNGIGLTIMTMVFIDRVMHPRAARLHAVQTGGSAA